MLIHLGGSKFIDLAECVAILNLETIDSETRKQIKLSTGKKLGAHFHAAILTTSGNWMLSTLSPEALSHRGLNEKFGMTFYKSTVKSFDGKDFLEFDRDSETGDCENA